MIQDDILLQFPLLNKNIVYLDSAATTQKPKPVIDAISGFYEKYNANAHRGAYKLSIDATKILDNARNTVGKYINSKNSNQIIFTKNATEAANLIAYSYGMDNLTSNNNVVISIMEHHANLVPWQYVTKKTNSNIKFLYLKDFEIDKEEIVSKITNETKIVCITHVSNVLGTINDIEYIIKYAHEKGAIVILDASQSIGHIKIDVQKLDVDFMFFSGHKMFAPLGVGVLYGKENLLNNMNPFNMGGDMIEYVYEDHTTFAPIPNKFEAGTQNLEAIYGLDISIKYIENIGLDNIRKIEENLTQYAISELKKLSYVELYIPKHHSSVVSFNIKGVHSHDVSSILDSLNICIRVGDHCAQPLIRYLGLSSTCRVSFAIYNTKEDVDKLIQGLEKVAKIFQRITGVEN